MSDSNQHTTHQTPPARGVGAWLAYLLVIAILLIAGYATWLVLKACGFQIFNRTVGFYWCQEPPAIVRELGQLEDRNRLLRNQIHDTQLALMTPEACGPVVDLTPDPIPEPVPEEEEEATYQCLPDQVFQQPNEVAIVLDGSGSMEYSVDVPEALEQRFLEAWNASNGNGTADLMGIFNQMAANQRVNDLDREIRSVPGESRMRVAREVMQEAVRSAPSAMAFNLTSFQECSNITSNSYGTDREGLMRAISRVRPGSGTPLAKAMRVAAGNLEGGGSADDPVNMVLVTDGNDSCRGDPCAAARTLKAQKPGLVINVVDLSQSDILSCVSNATGGTYRRSRGADMGDLVTAVQEAAGYDGAGQCRPAAPAATE